MSGPSAGEARILSFSRRVWLIGTIVVTAIALVTFPRIMLDVDTGRVFVDDGRNSGYAPLDYPWLQDEPRELEIIDGVVHGTAEGGYLRLPAGSEIMQASVTQRLDSAIHVSQSLAIPDPDEEQRHWPESVGYVSSPQDQLFLVPADDEGLLWFHGRGDAWELRLVPAQTTPVDARHSGSGSALLEYHGDALSARFIHDGLGIFRVIVAVPGENELAVNEVDTVNATASWRVPGRVLFAVDADAASGEWTITVHE